MALTDEDAVSFRRPDLDPSTLEPLAGDDLQQLRRFYVMFRAVCRWQHEALCRESSLGHFAEAASCARRLKASCLNIGALALGHAYGRVEAIASRCDGEELRASLADIDAQLEYTLANLGECAEGVVGQELTAPTNEAHEAQAMNALHENRRLVFPRKPLRAPAVRGAEVG